MSFPLQNCQKCDHEVPDLTEHECCFREYDEVCTCSLCLMDMDYLYEQMKDRRNQ